MNIRIALRSAVGAALLVGSAGAAYPWPAWLKAGILSGTTLGYYYGATYSTIYSFNPASVGTGEGLAPLAGVTGTSSGLLLGTTSEPARAYALLPPTGGSTSWSEAIIAQLGTGTATPLAALNDTTVVGTEPNASGTGDVFALTNNGSTIAKTVLYTFQGGGADGNVPTSGVTISSAGEIFGTASGGPDGGGIVYALI